MIAEKITTQAELEDFAWRVANMATHGGLPENLRLLIILNPHDFDSVVREIVPPWAQPEEESDRFIYTTQAGVEFGVKRGS